MSRRILCLTYAMAASLFIAGGAIGFVSAPEPAGGSISLAGPGNASLSERFSDLNLIASTNFAFAFRLLAGMLTLGAYSVLAMITFGLELGTFLAEVSAALPAAHLSALMLPHGLLELPALMVLASLEFQLAILVGIVLFNRFEAMQWQRVARSFGLQSVLALAMLAFAAPIEAFITGEIYELIR